MRHRPIVLASFLLAAPLLGACASSGIAVREFFGEAKRDQLVSRVEDAREDQEEAKAQFATALDAFLALPGVEAGELEDAYVALKRELDRSEQRAEDVRKRIRQIEDVAGALFAEWERELEDYADPELRERSGAQLQETFDQYNRLLERMYAAEATMDPVLAAFNDQVLFLKHNLNARAVASLGGSLPGLESDIQALITEMNASIAEADAFIEEMGGGV
jgi:outer membrane murein-binding lipoprotein Lpp